MSTSAAYEIVFFRSEMLGRVPLSSCLSSSRSLQREKRGESEEERGKERKKGGGGCIMEKVETIRMRLVQSVQV